MKREELLQPARDGGPWDIAIIGGGATGLGCAVDAASRGYRTILVEQHDFGKGTSSRSTKLIHGGVRYLEQGNISLVREALAERTRLLNLAPHVVKPLPILLPTYRRWETFKYRVGLKMYDWLAGEQVMQRSQRLSRQESVRRLPTLKDDSLRGSVLYYDGQFDDARLLVNLMQTAQEQGATCLNYVRAAELTKEQGKISGLIAIDEETGDELRLDAKVVVNATGPFVDAVRRMEEASAAAWIAPSQGVHLVFDRSFLPSDHALIVPETSDGRVMFAIPWHGHTLVGTTDTALEQVSLEPQPHQAEIDFLLETTGQYLTKTPSRDDVLSTFVGIRPLVRKGSGGNTAELSRDHVLRISDAGLVTITGGKWTTYRRMAEDCIDKAAEIADLAKQECRTDSLPIHGAAPVADPGEISTSSDPLAIYGSDGENLEALLRDDESLREPLHPQLPYIRGQVVWAARHEQARTVEDVLARRTRALLLNARAAAECAPQVAELLSNELGCDEQWRQQQVAAFAELVDDYL